MCTRWIFAAASQREEGNEQSGYDRRNDHLSFE